MMLSQTFYAMTRAWTPTLIGLATSVLWVAVAFLGVEKLGYGLAAIAGAESLSKTVKCVVMWVMLRPHLGNVKGRDNAFFTLKVIAGALLSAIFATLLIRSIAPHSDASHFKLKMLLAVSVAGVFGLSVFLGVASLLKIEETRAFGKVWKRVAGKLAR